MSTREGLSFTTQDVKLRNMGSRLLWLWVTSARRIRRSCAVKLEPMGITVAMLLLWSSAGMAESNRRCHLLDSAFTEARRTGPTGLVVWESPSLWIRVGLLDQSKIRAARLLKYVGRELRVSRTRPLVARTDD
jgi:hypothetical protein